MEVKELVEYMKDVKIKRNKLEKAMDEKRQEEIKLKEEVDSKIDKNSGFYKDAENERKSKHIEWVKIFNEREKYKKDSDKEILNMKEKLIKELQEKAEKIDENRNLNKQEREKKVNDGYKNVQELNLKLYAKKQELKYYETTLPENEEKSKIIGTKQKEIKDIDMEIKEKIGKIKVIQNEQPEKLYNEIKNEIEYIRKLTIENLENNKTDKPKEQQENNKTDKLEEQQENNKTDKTEEQQENNKTSKPEEQQENNKTSKPEEQQENNRTSKQEEQQENNRTDKTEEQKGKNKTDRPEEKQEQQEKNKTDEPEEEYEDIYSNSKDSIKAIYIEAATGKAYIDTFKNNKKEIDIKEAIENRKGLYKRINLKEIMEKAGVESRINQFMLKRKINPVILEAINEDEKMTEEYIYSLIEKKEFPFEYKHDLENSNLSFKDMALMNRVALKESKIDGNEVIGAKKLYTIKSFFGKIKNKALAKFNKKEEPKMINEKNERQEDTKSKKERFYESIEYTPEEQTASDIELEQKNKYNEAYEKLTDEQKAKLATMDVSNIQRLLGFDYNTAVALREMTNNEDKKVTQESTTKEDKKVTQESTTKEDDESQR